MKLIIKLFYLTLFLFLVYSCKPDGIDGPVQFEDFRKCKDGYTCLKGRVIDTTGVTTGIPDAKIIMIPSLLDTSSTTTDDYGNFWLESSEFDEDQAYIVRIDMEGYFGNNWTNIRVDMDTINELNAKVLDRKPDFDAIIDSIKLKDGGGDGPTEN